MNKGSKEKLNKGKTDFQSKAGSKVNINGKKTNKQKKKQQADQTKETLKTQKPTHKPTKLTAARLLFSPPLWLVVYFP